MLDLKKIIIEKPEAIDKTVSLRDKIITFIFWGALIYIFRPLFALILWILFGMHIFNPEVFNIELYDEISRFLVKNSFTIFVFAVIFITWAVYNKIMYGKLRRRKFVPKVTDKEIAEFFKVDIEKLKKWKELKYIKFKIIEKNNNFEISDSL
ncbi:poly-beta-1,6-N-acetyl-D-glucosamine biosynthesis protein PgaD [Nitrosophilus kaiyonis]|uniref:poly-beta-1,6-N-acetyl-D-glucosamine biosynthesis protein PgaD n=1 Tax=Nitrosophilus kaiyonis TaxID=2930200 RepID=UPI002492E373|nr:poly-beta-1,6-N-acetyl-D-glucosamine biosynthesis protein PgaD [Nitrosophilus kaiyonis]